jgi:hypothetical protein
MPHSRSVAKPSRFELLALSRRIHSFSAERACHS